MTQSQAQQAQSLQRALLLSLSSLALSLVGCRQEPPYDEYSVDFSSCLQSNTLQRSNLHPTCGGDLRDRLNNSVSFGGCWRVRGAGEGVGEGAGGGEGEGGEQLFMLPWRDNSFQITTDHFTPLSSPPFNSRVDMDLWAYINVTDETSCEAAISRDPECRQPTCLMHISREDATLSASGSLSFRDEVGACAVTTPVLALQGRCDIAQLYDAEVAGATPPDDGGDMGLSDMGLSDMGLSDMGLSDMGLSDMGLSDMGFSDMGGGGVGGGGATPVEPASECERRSAELGAECAVTGGRGECAQGRWVCDDERGALVCEALDPSPERCDGLDNDCDGVVDDLTSCGNLIAERCELWVAWARDDGYIGSADAPHLVWGVCPERERTNPRADSGIAESSCASSHGDWLFHSLEIGNIFDGDASEGRFGLMWRCGPEFGVGADGGALTPEEIASLAWANTSCGASLYLNSSRSIALQGQVDPQACAASDDAERAEDACVSSPSRAFSEIGMPGGFSRNAHMGVRFTCATPASSGSGLYAPLTLGQLIQRSVMVELALTRGSASAGRDCSQPANSYSARDIACVESGEDGVINTVQLSDVSVSDGTRLSVSLKPRYGAIRAP